MTAEFHPEANLICLALQLAWEQTLPVHDTTWAMVWELDEDGQAAGLPLTIARLDRWMALAWETTDESDPD